jgi:phage protein U
MSQTAYNPALDRTNDADSTRSGVGSFGQVVFQVSEDVLSQVRNVQRKTTAKVEEHQVVGSKPRLEFIAPELDETTFTVFWHRGFGVNPRTEIKKLRELCLAGAVQHLILGGENFGRYLLTGVNESWLRSGPGGAPLVAEASLTLKEYC